MSQTPVFSVIIPTYNRAHYLAHAIQSALDQRLSHDAKVEVIVVDDQSTDNTPDVAQTFADRIVYLRQIQNRREGAARNAGAARASGTYFAFLDSDDYWLPGKLGGDLLRFEQADHPALVYSNGCNVDPLDRLIGERHLAHPQGDVFWMLAREAFMPMSSVAVRADAFRECGGFVEDRDLSGTADWELWMRLAARWPVGYTPHTKTCAMTKRSYCTCTIANSAAVMRMTAQASPGVRCQPRNRKPRNSVSSPNGVTTTTTSHSQGSQPALAAVR